MVKGHMNLVHRETVSGGASIRPPYSAANNLMNRDANGFHIEQHGAEGFTKLAGSITIDSSPELRRVLLRMLKSPDSRRFTLDFSEVVYIDTSGLAVLIEVLRSARQLGKGLQLTGLRERPRYLLESTGLLRLFDEAPTKQ
jgi:anti-sigma B factor antagonist